jgi:hypothetical protein
MGYYVHLQYIDTKDNTNIIIKKENIDAAYAALCELNTNPKYDILKSGGKYGGDSVAKNDNRPDNLDHHPARWFSWMESDYHKHTKNLEEILACIGFDFEFKDGNLCDLRYSDKTGNEDIFFCALAPFIENGVEIVWSGEEGERWKWIFNNGEMFFHESKVLYKKQGSKITLDSRIKNSSKMNDFMKELLSTVPLSVEGDS